MNGKDKIKELVYKIGASPAQLKTYEYEFLGSEIRFSDEFNLFDLTIKLNTLYCDDAKFDSLKEMLNVLLNQLADNLKSIRPEYATRKFRELYKTDEKVRASYQIDRDEAIYKNGREIIDCTSEPELHRIGVFADTDMDFFYGSLEDFDIKLYTLDGLYVAEITFKRLFKNDVDFIIEWFREEANEDEDEFIGEDEFLEETAGAKTMRSKLPFL